MSDTLDKYKKLLRTKIDRNDLFPRKVNMSWENGEENNLIITDQEFDLIKEEFSEFRLSRGYYICGGENDSSIEEYVLVEKFDTI